MFAHERSHNHDGDRFAALGEHLDGINDVSEGSYGAKGGSHGGESEYGEACWRNGGGCFVPYVSSGGCREGVEAGGDKEKAEFVQFSVSRRGVLQQQSVANEAGHDTEETYGQPKEFV